MDPPAIWLLPTLFILVRLHDNGIVADLHVQTTPASISQLMLLSEA